MRFMTYLVTKLVDLEKKLKLRSSEQLQTLQAYKVLLSSRRNFDEDWAIES